MATPHRRTFATRRPLAATTVWAAVAAATAAGLAMSVISPASAALMDVPVLGAVDVPFDIPGVTYQPGPNQRHITTIDGLGITLEVHQQDSTTLPSVDPLSREGVVTTHLIAKIDGLDGREDVSARLSTGYTVGYPIQVAPNGVSVSVTTPQITMSGGVNATLNPEVSVSGTGGGGSVGEIGVEAGVSATVIPETTATFDLGAGGAQDMTVAETWLTSAIAELFMGGTHVVVSNAFGPVTVRPYATLTVTTANGVYDLPVYGANTMI